MYLKFDRLLNSKSEINDFEEIAPIASSLFKYERLKYKNYQFFVFIIFHLFILMLYIVGNLLQMDSYPKVRRRLLR